MNGYISVREAAERWNITERQVQKLCAEGRIDGVTRFANAWAIPDDTKNRRAQASLNPVENLKQVM